MPPTPPTPDALLPLKNEVLWLLMSLNQRDGHGYGLMQDVAERSDGEVRIQTGALYRLLHRMEADGLIGEARPPADEADERRRYYRITRFGRMVLAAELARMRVLVDSGVRDGVLPERGPAT